MLAIFSWLLEIRLNTVYLTYPLSTYHHRLQWRIRNIILTQPRQLIQIIIVIQHNSPPIILTSQTYHAHTSNKKQHFLNYAMMLICSFVKIIISTHTYSHTQTHTYTQSFSLSLSLCIYIYIYIYLTHTQTKTKNKIKQNKSKKKRRS